MDWNNQLILEFRNWGLRPRSESVRMTYCLILICGTLAHFHWRAALTSALTVSSIKVCNLWTTQSLPCLNFTKFFHIFLQYPFHTLQELADTDYCLSYHNSSVVHHVLSTSEPNSIFGQLWKNVSLLRWANKNKKYNYIKRMWKRTYIAI